jgi:hypothetical protein
MRYRLRTLLIALTALCLLLGFLTEYLRWSRERNTRRTLNRLATDIEMHALANGEMPKPETRLIVRDLNSNGSHLPDWFLQRRATYPGIEQGIDSWGRQLIVESLNGTIVLRSAGPNGLDDKGKGDDIQRFIDCRAILDSPATILTSALAGC